VSVAGLAATHWAAAVPGLTGAGVSTEAHPDFRSPAGSGLTSIPSRSHPFKLSGAIPAVWDFTATGSAAPRRRAERSARALARLGGGRLSDRHPEHRHAALARRQPPVIEVHGSIRSAQCRCLWTRRQCSRIGARFRSARTVVRCSARVTLGAPSSWSAGASDGTRAYGCAPARRRIVARVWPVAGLPLEARSFAIVNRGPTALDDRAASGRRAAGEILGALVADLLEPGLANTLRPS
jgi:hypothetical protein